MRVVAFAVALLLAGAALACPGDCDGDGTVRIDEVVGLVACALGTAPQILPCLTCADRDASGGIEVHELIAAVAGALDGCSTFTLHVYLQEFPGEGSQVGACVELQPLGRTTQDFRDGYVFTDLPPGDYQVAPALDCGGAPCNSFGCWDSPVPVAIADRDVTITVPLRAAFCRRDRDCGNTVAQCVAPDDVLCGFCRDDPDACAGDGDCGPGRVCISASRPPCPCDGSPALICAPACDGDAGCAPGAHCGADGHCTRPACSGDADCGGAEFCVLGHCYDERGTCQLPPP